MRETAYLIEHMTEIAKKVEDVITNDGSKLSNEEMSYKIIEIVFEWMQQEGR